MKKLDSILLIDDNPDDNYFHQLILEKMQAAEHVDIAMDGEEALDFLQSHTSNPPDLIFLDINMPRMNGFEFLEAYKALAVGARAKVIIMLTTSINPADRQKAEQIPEVIGFEHKPLNEKMLAELVERYF